MYWFLYVHTEEQSEDGNGYFEVMLINDIDRLDLDKLEKVPYDELKTFPYEYVIYIAG